MSTARLPNADVESGNSFRNNLVHKLSGLRAAIKNSDNELGEDVIRNWVYASDNTRDTFVQALLIDAPGRLLLDWLRHEELLHDLDCGVPVDRVVIKKLAWEN